MFNETFYGKNSFVIDNIITLIKVNGKEIFLVLFFHIQNKIHKVMNCLFENLLNLQKRVIARSVFVHF